MARSCPETVAMIIRPCGLYNTRADWIVRMSLHWALEGPPDAWDRAPKSYVKDSDAIFGLGDLSVEPGDKELRAYIDWARTAEPRPDWRSRS
jgi:hypothetical protein